MVTLLAACELIQPTETYASRDVLDALYAGMKRAQDESADRPPVDPADPRHGRGPREDSAP